MSASTSEARRRVNVPGRGNGRMIPMQEQGNSESSDWVDPFDEALGVYVGLATLDDAIAALAAHTPGEWVIRLTDPDGKSTFKNGWSWYVEDEDEREAP